jgi:hypothetical protein
LAKFKSGASVSSVRDEVQAIEHQADDFVRKMEDALARTFVTPLDREDLHRLAAGLDDVVDLTNLAARACVLYGVQRPTPTMVQLMDVLTACTQVLKEGIPKLRVHDYVGLLEMGRSLRSLEKEADTIYRAAVSALFVDPAIDAKELLKQKEVLEDLERAVDHCDNVADLLTSIAVKHG